MYAVQKLLFRESLTKKICDVFCASKPFYNGINRVQVSLQGTFHSSPGILNSLNVKVVPLFYNSCQMLHDILFLKIEIKGGK